MPNVRNANCVQIGFIYRWCISFSFFFIFSFISLLVYIKLFYSLFLFEIMISVWMHTFWMNDSSNLIINIYLSSAKIIDIIRTDFNLNIYSIESILIRIARWFNSLRSILSYLSYSSICIYIYIYISFSCENRIF